MSGEKVRFRGVDDPIYLFERDNPVQVDLEVVSSDSEEMTWVLTLPTEAVINDFSIEGSAKEVKIVFVSCEVSRLEIKFKRDDNNYDDTFDVSLGLLGIRIHNEWTDDDYEVMRFEITYRLNQEEMLRALKQSAAAAGRASGSVLQDQLRRPGNI